MYQCASEGLCLTVPESRVKLIVIPRAVHYNLPLGYFAVETRICYSKQPTKCA